MSNPARSLNASIGWQRLLRELGLPVNQWSLPVQTACPICEQGVLNVYEDFVVGGQWHRCQDCGSTGDLIELASRVWKLSIPATIVKLGRWDYEMPHDQASINKYIEQHLEYRQRLNELWRDAQAEMKQPSGELQRLREQFNLRCEVPTERWHAGPGSLLGGTTTERIERAFAPGVMDHADEKGQRCSPSEHAIFAGKGWRDALIMPYYDLPGRICGFLFVGRDGKYPDDFVYRRANRGPRGNQYGPEAAEAGLAMHPQALESSNDWERVVVATAKPMTALALQMRHLEQSQRALPLVCHYDSIRRTQQHGDSQRVRTTNAWQLLGNRQLIFWMPEFCVATIQQAIAVNGLIATVGPLQPSVEALQEYMWKRTPRDLLRHIIHSARPWPESLARAFNGMDNTKIERHVQRMQVDGVDLEREIKKCGSTTQRRVRGMFDQASQRVGRLITGKTVVERSGGWFERGRLGQESLISDGIVRIDRILYQRTQKQTYAQGRIIYHGQSVDFCEPQEQLEKQGLRWAQDVLLQRGIGFMNFNPYFHHRLVDLARVFLEPKVETAITSIGWNEEQRQFVFPKFAIDERGEVVCQNNMILDRPIPAQLLQRPDYCLTPEELDRAKGKGNATKVFWAVLGSMIANIIAPACQQRRTGIALVGAGAEQMGQALASALGCLTIEMESAKDVRRALELEQSHGWPMLALERRPLQRRFRRELLSSDRRSERNLMFGVDWVESRMLALGGKWSVIEERNKVEVRPELMEFAAKFVPAYIQDLCRRRMVLGHWRELSDAHTENVLRDKARFAKEQGGHAAPILAAGKLILPAREGGNATALADLIAYWMRTGDLRIEEEGCQHQGLTLVRIRDKNAYLLTYGALDELAKDVAVDVPRFDRIVAMLEYAGVLVETRPEGCVIDGPWIDEKIKTASLPLRVIC